MKYYNLYYLGTKINNRPIDEDEIDTIKQSKQIYKKNQITNKLESIDVKNIKFVKTIII